MYTTLAALLLLSAIVLLTGILLQPNGSGFGSAWGGGGESYHTRRGVERVVFIMTIVAAVIFTVVSIALLVVT